MNKYINTFASSGDYETYKASSAFTTPNVAYLEDSNEVVYEKKNLYNIYGTLTGDSATATIKINNTNYPVSPSGSDNEFGLVFTEPVTGLSFYNQQSIKTLDKLDIDTSSVTTSMVNLFLDCSRLVSLDLSSFDTSSATNMHRMFGNCTALTSLDVSHFNTSGVTSMREMFSGCQALTTLNLSNFDTNKASNKQGMFSGCTALTTLDISNFKANIVTSETSMFNGCNALTTLTMNSTSQATFDKIKAQLVTDKVASHVTIIRDGMNWKYQNGAWVEA